MLSWEVPTAFEQLALSIGLVAFFPVVFLAAGYFRSPPGEFEFELQGTWLLCLGAVILPIGLTAWNLAMRPTSAYNNGLLLEAALLGVPAVHLFTVALRNRLSNQSLERTRAK